MLHLLLSTLAMMGLTFVIGFFVAGVIKLIAWIADSMDFYSSHQEELARLRRLRKIHQKVATLITESAIDEIDYNNGERENFSRGIDKSTDSSRGFYHGVSYGAPRTDLMDYYYPEDTHRLYLRKEEQMMRKKKSSKKLPSTDKNK